VSSSVLLPASGNRQQNQQEVRVRSKLEAKPQLHESVPVCKGPADKTVAPYDRAARYRRLLQCVAERVLDDYEKAEVVVRNCLHLTFESAPDCEGAFRAWLVRLVVDEAFTFLHATRGRERRHTDKVTPAYCDPAANGCGRNHLSRIC